MKTSTIGCMSNISLSGVNACGLSYRMFSVSALVFITKKPSDRIK